MLAMNSISASLLQLCSVLAITATVATAGTLKSQCSDVSFKLPISYQSHVYGSPPDPRNETQHVNFLTSTLSGYPAPISGTKLVSATFTINGVYCKPNPAVRPQRNALQLLVHGITYNKDMWSGLGLGDRYNWHLAANADGYHTLAIDRIGHGPGAKTALDGKSFPDPLNVMQGAFHAESLFQLITTIRGNTKKNALGCGFNKIIYVGHSYGSQLGTYLASAHPTSISALILTGYSASVNLATASAFTFRSAANIRPSSFPATQPLGYIASLSAADREHAFFAGNYDRTTIIPADFRLQDTVTTGEAGTLVEVALTAAGGYTGPVFVATGDRDFVFCETGTGAGAGERCEAVVEATVRGMFPGVVVRGPRWWGFFVPRGTGHCLTLHYSVGETVREVGAFLGRFF